MQHERASLAVKGSINQIYFLPMQERLHELEGQHLVAETDWKGTMKGHQTH